MNTIETLMSSSEYCETDACEYGHAYAEISTGNREGLSIQFNENWGWSAAKFYTDCTLRTEHFQNRITAIEALNQLNRNKKS